MSATCARTDEVRGLLLRVELRPQDHALLEHLRECESCKAAYESLLAHERGLTSDASPEVPGPLEVERGLQRMLAEQAAPKPRRRWFAVPALAGAVALALVLARPSVEPDMVTLKGGGAGEALDLYGVCTRMDDPARTHRVEDGGQCAGAAALTLFYTYRESKTQRVSLTARDSRGREIELAAAAELRGPAVDQRIGAILLLSDVAPGPLKVLAGTQVLLSIEVTK